jgi:hypothetical protein
MILQLKSVCHRLNFIVYCYMFQSPWDYHQAVYIINTINLTEITIIKTIKVVENFAFCYNENYNIKKY